MHSKVRREEKEKLKNFINTSRGKFYEYFLFIIVTSITLKCIINIKQ